MCTIQEMSCTNGIKEVDSPTTRTRRMVERHIGSFFNEKLVSTGLPTPLSTVDVTTTNLDEIFDKSISFNKLDRTSWIGKKVPINKKSGRTRRGNRKSTNLSISEITLDFDASASTCDHVDHDTLSEDGANEDYSGTTSRNGRSRRQVTRKNSSDRVCDLNASILRRPPAAPRRRSTMDQKDNFLKFCMSGDTFMADFDETGFSTDDDDDDVDAITIDANDDWENISEEDDDVEESEDDALDKGK